MLPYPLNLRRFVVQGNQTQGFLFLLDAVIVQFEVHSRLAPLIDDQRVGHFLGNIVSCGVLLHLIYQQRTEAIAFVDAASGAIEEVDGLLGIPLGIVILQLHLDHGAILEGEERFF